MNAVRVLIYSLAASAAVLPAMAQTGASAEGAEPMRLAQAERVSITGLQEMLNQLGYGAGPVDGVMGSGTRSAIMAYQRDQGLPVTGEADAQLYRHLYETYTEAAAQAGTDAPAVEPEPAPELTEGQRDTVIAVQTELRRRGYDVPAITGELDEATRGAIRAYKRDAGLAVDSRIDRALVTSLDTTAAGDYAARRDLIRDIQMELNDRGYAAGAVTGTLTPETQAAIRTYQADYDLPVTGEPSADLLAAIRPATATPSVRAADAVAAIQSELKARGYFEGAADGEVGPATSAAIRAFQRDAGLPVTGEANPETLAAVRASDVTRRTVERQQVVADIQEELAARGYPVGQPDGEMGPETAAAIRAFQRDAGLPVTGEASAQLLTQIRGSEVTAGPATPEEALQSIIQGTTRRLFESIERQE